MSEKGKCISCGIDITPGSFGYCVPCAEKAHEDMRKEFPFEVVDSDGCHVESFKSEKEAQDFVDKMRYCQVKEREPW